MLRVSLVSGHISRISACLVNLGYSDSANGYLCLSSAGRIYISQNVVFNEEDFPFASGFQNTRQAEETFTINSQNWFRLSQSPEIHREDDDVGPNLHKEYDGTENLSPNKSSSHSLDNSGSRYSKHTTNSSPPVHTSTNLLERSNSESQSVRIELLSPIQI